MTPARYSQTFKSCRTALSNWFLVPYLSRKLVICSASKFLLVVYCLPIKVEIAAYQGRDCCPCTQCREAIHYPSAHALQFTVICFRPKPTMVHTLRSLVCLNGVRHSSPLYIDLGMTVTPASERIRPSSPKPLLHGICVLCPGLCCRNMFSSPRNNIGAPPKKDVQPIPSREINLEWRSMSRIHIRDKFTNVDFLTLNSSNAWQIDIPPRTAATASTKASLLLLYKRGAGMTTHFFE